MRRAAAALALLLLAAPLGGQELEEKPFPTEKSTILRKGKVRYVVEGKMTIPEGVEISVQKDVYIVAKGEGATIRVEGTLDVHGVYLREVIFEGVTIELAPKVKDVRLDQVVFRNGGGLVTEPKTATTGNLTVLNATFKDTAAFDVTFAQGLIDLSEGSTSDTTRIRAEKKEGQEKNKVRVSVRGSNLNNLHIAKADDATVRLTQISGGTAEFRDCRTLTFDGNKVNATVLDIAHTIPGGLAKTRVTKCDIYSETVILKAPKRDGRSVDKVVFDRCWWRGETDPKVVRKNILKDAGTSPENGAKIALGKLMKRPNELAGAIDR
ncbi:MAG: hypothetical protein ACYS99_10415 [Planctomycetota bacterium]|jgi:hypothetical protein